MKKYFILSLFFFLCMGHLFPETGENYVGGDIIFNSVQLNSSEVRGGGFGIGFFYQSFFTPGFSYLLNAGFLDNAFSQDLQETIFYPTTGSVILEYTQEENFYSFPLGLLFEYSRVYRNFRPYFSCGTLCSFIYKTYHYTYRTDPGSFIETQKKSRWLPAVLFVPFILGTHYFLDQKNIIDFNLSYLIPFWDKTVENYGYRNVIQVKLGYMRLIKFKL